MLTLPITNGARVASRRASSRIALGANKEVISANNALQATLFMLRPPAAYYLPSTAALKSMTGGDKILNVLCARLATCLQMIRLNVFLPPAHLFRTASHA